MANNEGIIEEAKYYLNNDVTFKQASHNLGISLRTFQLHIEKLAEISPSMFKLVQEKKQKNVANGRVTGGSIGKRKTSWTEEEKVAIADKILAEGWTYREAEEKLGIPKATLYDIVHDIDSVDTQSSLSLLSEANRHNMSSEEYHAINGRKMGK